MLVDNLDNENDDRLITIYACDYNDNDIVPVEPLFEAFPSTFIGKQKMKSQSLNYERQLKFLLNVINKDSMMPKLFGLRVNIQLRKYDEKEEFCLILSIHHGQCEPCAKVSLMDFECRISRETMESLKDIKAYIDRFHDIDSIVFRSLNEDFLTENMEKLLLLFGDRELREFFLIDDSASIKSSLVEEYLVLLLEFDVTELILQFTKTKAFTFTNVDFWRSVLQSVDSIIMNTTIKKVYTGFTLMEMGEDCAKILACVLAKASLPLESRHGKIIKSKTKSAAKRG